MTELKAAQYLLSQLGREELLPKVREKLEEKDEEIREARNLALLDLPPNQSHNVRAAYARAVGHNLAVSLLRKEMAAQVSQTLLRSLEARRVERDQIVFRIGTELRALIDWLIDNPPPGSRKQDLDSWQSSWRSLEATAFTASSLGELAARFGVTPSSFWQKVSRARRALLGKPVGKALVGRIIPPKLSPALQEFLEIDAKARMGKEKIPGRPTAKHAPLASRRWAIARPLRAKV